MPASPPGKMLTYASRDKQNVENIYETSATVAQLCVPLVKILGWKACLLHGWFAGGMESLEPTSNRLVRRQQGIAMHFKDPAVATATMQGALFVGMARTFLSYWHVPGFFLCKPILAQLL
jgi:hypothetical protein